MHHHPLNVWPCGGSLNGMDIHSKSPYPAGELSNFYPHPFIHDGEECASMEGLLQSLKYSDPVAAANVRKLHGGSAKEAGELSGYMKGNAPLWWKGQPIDRHGVEYKEFITEAFDSLSTSESFREALEATGDEALTHEVGNDDPHETILTADEFVGQLNRLRSKLFN